MRKWRDDIETRRPRTRTSHISSGDTQIGPQTSASLAEGTTVSSSNPTCSEGISARLSRADAHHAIHLSRPDLPVADLPRLCRCDDDVHHLVDDGFVDQNLELHLRDEADRILTATEHFALPSLPSVALHFARRHPEDACSAQCILHLFELERFDYRCYEIDHGPSRAIIDE